MKQVKKLLIYYYCRFVKCCFYNNTDFLNGIPCLGKRWTALVTYQLLLAVGSGSVLFSVVALDFIRI